MKKKYIYICLSVLVIILALAWGVKGILTAQKLKANDSAKKAYFMGHKLGQDIRKVFKTKTEHQLFTKGLKQGIKGKKSLVSLESMRALQKEESKKVKQQGENNMSEGKTFLENNSQKPGIKTTASGLQYKVLKEGQGLSPKAKDTVKVHYRGTFINGQEFDSSYKRNQSISFRLNNVIRGWTEGLKLMKEGAKYELYIPSELAYGEQGAPPSIPPNAVLIFEVELIKVNP